jgi:hypothetical protein
VKTLKDLDIIDHQINGQVAEASGLELLHTNLLGVNCYLLSWEVHSHVGVFADDVAIIMSSCSINSKARCKTS